MTVRNNRSWLNVVEKDVVLMLKAGNGYGK